MANLKFSNNTLSNSKLGAFNHRTGGTSAGQKTRYAQIPAFYLGSEIKEHFPYAKDENGKKIAKKGGSTRYTEYERETTSDGWIFFLNTPGKDLLYIVTAEKPELEVGSFYLVSGLGYGHGQYPTFIDEGVKLELSGQLTLLDDVQTVVDEEA